MRGGFRLLRLMAALIWSVAVVGVCAWVVGAWLQGERITTTTGPCSPIVNDADAKGNVRIEINGAGQASCQQR